MSLVDKVSIVWCLQKQFIYSFLIMSNKLHQIDESGTQWTHLDTLPYVLRWHYHLGLYIWRTSSPHISGHHLQTKHQIDWDSATCITYSKDYYQRLTLESWFTNLEQKPLNRSQLPAPYKRLIDEVKQDQIRENDWTRDNLKDNRRLFDCDNRRIEKHQLHYESSQPMTSLLNWQTTNNMAT